MVLSDLGFPHFKQWGCIVGYFANCFGRLLSLGGQGECISGCCMCVLIDDKFVDVFVINFSNNRIVILGIGFTDKF